MSLGDLKICGDILEAYLNTQSNRPTGAGIGWGNDTYLSSSPSSPQNTTAVTNNNSKNKSSNHFKDSLTKSIPWVDLRYLFGEIMYGGHVTDFFDRRTNNTYLNVSYITCSVYLAIFLLLSTCLMVT